MQVLAIDIGGTSVKYGYVDSNGKIADQSSFWADECDTLSVFLGKIYEIVSIASGKGITSVGISSLGIFESAGLCLGGVENLPFLEQVNLVELLESKFPEVRCEIMNDGTAAAMGEYWLGEGKECESFICITLGTGIGGAIILDGKPLLGSHFQSGEIGYTNYRSEQDYLELAYSTAGILEQAKSRLGISEMTGLEFVDKVKHNDNICVELFEEWMEQLAGMIANAILLLDPEKVIIGGGISGQKDWICDALNEKLQMRLPQAFRGKTLVRAAKNGNDAGLLGAAEIFLNH